MRRVVLGFLAILLLAAPAPAAFAQAAPAAAPQQSPSAGRARLTGKVCDAVWHRVKREYYDPTFQGLDWDEIGGSYRPRALAAIDEAELYRVLGEMLDLLDDAHAAAQSPTQARQEANRNQPRPLLGVQVGRDNGRYVLQDVRPGSPADAAGVELGWELRSVDGRPFAPGEPLTAGQPVTVEFVDDTGAVRPISITPQVLQAPMRRTAVWAAPGVLMLTFDGFDRGVTRWIDSELDRAPPGTRLILDVRSNRGGLVAEVRGVLSCFLPRGRVWAHYESRGRRQGDLKVGGGCSPFDGPLAVLVSGASRSAAELTPGALQEAGRATIVGRRTAGAVLISVESRLPDGGRLNLSIQDVKLANGVRLEHQGVAPDVEAFTTLADRRAGSDPALEAAVRALGAAPANDNQAQ
jgi:carboxyl-terminal processing protease